MFIRFLLKSIKFNDIITFSFRTTGTRTWFVIWISFFILIHLINLSGLKLSLINSIYYFKSFAKIFKMSSIFIRNFLYLSIDSLICKFLKLNLKLSFYLILNCNNFLFSLSPFQHCLKIGKWWKIWTTFRYWRNFLTNSKTPK